MDPPRDIEQDTTIVVAAVYCGAAVLKVGHRWTHHWTLPAAAARGRTLALDLDHLRKMQFEFSRE